MTSVYRVQKTNKYKDMLSYEEAKQIIIEHNIKTKREYFDLCNKDIRLPKEPKEVYSGYYKGWIDYLSVEQSYYDLDTCKKKVKEYLALYPEIKNHGMYFKIICEKLCELDKNFPPNDLWVEYYNSKSITDIITLNKKIVMPNKKFT